MRRIPLAFLRRTGLLVTPVLLSTACPSDDTSVTSADDSESSSEDDNDDNDDNDDDNETSATPTTETMDPDSSSTDPTEEPTTTDPTDDTTTTDPTEETTTDDPTDDTTTTGDLCGNGTVDDGEECDGDDLADQTCSTQSFDDGTLACNDDCTFNTDACINFSCGNDEIEGKELCDGNDLGGATCESEGFPLGGVLACDDNCGGYDTAGCIVAQCGNGVAEDTEVCDGQDFLGETCQSMGFVSGNLGCLDDCSSLDTTNCSLCGNGVADPGEACDGDDLQGQDCFTSGYDGGAIGCNAQCQLDVAACTEITTTQFCVQPGTPILDLQTATTQIPVAGLQGTVTDVDVFVNATHTWVSDLTAITTHLDSGNAVTLFGAACGSSDNVNVTFDDEAGAFVCPLTGPATMDAQGDLDAFATSLGGNPNGTYELSIADAFNGDTGTIVEWCVDITTEAPVGEPVEIRPNLLVCGNPSRDVTTFIPDGVDLTLIESCFPDDDTQAIIYSRDAIVDAPSLSAYIAGGGIALTEIFITDDVYNAAFNEAQVEIGFIGSCQDTLPTVVQFSAGDTFWTDNGFQAIGFGESGCGNNVISYPGVTPLAGWSANEVGVGYRDDGPGRVWLTAFDWQDTDTVGPPYAYTEQLMGYMILNNGDGGGGGGGQADFAFTGGEQQFVVPQGVFSVHIAAFGAEGGAASNNVAFCAGAPDLPGLGGHAEGDLAVSPGDVLSVFVGGAGGAGDAPGFNGGGGSCPDATTCGSGGGASDVRAGGNGLANRVIVAGAGGGAEYSCGANGGGAGGGLEGGNGLGGDTPTSDGLGGTQLAGGAGGPGAPGVGQNGALGQGGAAEADSIHGGGGGGGYYGGGGGGTDGHGGGGSSYVGGVSNGVTNSGVQSGNGVVTITW
jgi:subtilisin-like proprotein convertase family protein